MINSISYNQYQTSFKANLNSPKLRYNQKDFFIKIRGYGRNSEWAREVIKVADAAVFELRKKTPVEEVLKLIALGMSSANKIPLDLAKRVRTGILRTKREDWHSVEDTDLRTSYTNNRYKCYEKRLDEVAKNPLDEPSNNIAMSRPGLFDDIYHLKAEYVNNSLDYVFELCSKIFPKYSKKGVKSKDIDKINNIVAEIRWVMAHATPWLRGSDAISNVFMRAIYKAVGIKAYPPAKGISFDLEAYCTNLEDYKKNFSSYFEKPPIVIE